MISDDIGVIVIGRNEGGRLIDCLTSVQSNVKSVVYVDSGSTDGSTQTAERLGARVVPLNTGQPFTAARARNEGFAVLTKLRPDIQLVQFIDGDCELDQGWLNLAADFIKQRNDIAAICGRRRERYPSSSIYNRLCDIEWDTPVGQTIACGGDSLVRTKAFEAVGGFRAQLIAGEEPELCLRLREKGWKIWRLDAEMTRHDAAITRFGQWWVRSVRSGYGIAEVSRLHWHSPFAIWKREVARAVFWSVLLPVLIGIGAVMQPVALTAVLIYPLQVCRIAVARGPTSSHSWIYGLFVTLSKFAELQGVLKFYWRRLRRQSIDLIEYK
jgi:glycosyltransferase involved in cell wall biosynthesis